MRISTRLTLAALVPALVALVAVGGVLFSYSPTVDLQRRQIAIVQTRGDLDQLDGFARSYLDHHDARSREQFLAASDEASRDINTAASGGGAGYGSTLLTVAQDVRVVRELFDRIVSINGKRAGANLPVDREAEAQLSGQLFIRSADAKTTIGGLVQSISAAIVTREQRTSTAVTLMTIIAASLLTGGLLALRRRITLSLGALNAGTEAVGSGNLDYRIGLSSADEFGDLSRSFDRMSERLKSLTFSRDELEIIADRLQDALVTLPDALPGVEFASAYRSATEAARVGGDFYDLFDLDQDRIGILIGDISGKGLDAAVLTSLVKNTIRAHANETGKTPAQVLTLTNDIVFKDTPTEVFATVFFAVLDCRDGLLVYTNAGHTTSAVIRNDAKVDRLPVTGALLGAFGGTEYDELEDRLEPGDLLFMYTDGLTEARSDGEQYGEERVFAFLATTAGMRAEDIVSGAISDVMSFTGAHLADDLAILAVRRMEPNGET